jgi:MFS family permease
VAHDLIEASGTTSGCYAVPRWEALLIDRWTLGVCAARIFLFANFMTVAAVIPILLEEWHLSGAAAGAIVTSFTVAYAASLFLYAWAADHIGARRSVEVSAVMSAITSAAFGLFAHDWASAFVLYGLVGLAQGGVYTPLIMLFAERHDPVRRGTAMGWLVASTSVGYASSLFLSGLALRLGGYHAAFLVTGFTPALGAVLLLVCLRGSENRVHQRRSTGSLWHHVFGDRDAGLLTAGYTAHCWELLGSWAWLPSLLAAAFALGGSSIHAASESGALTTGTMHLGGAAASFVMGSLSDRLGRRAVLLSVAAAAAALSLPIGWVIWLPAGLFVGLALVYTFLTIGDSPVLTTAITEVTDPGRLGAVLAVRSLLGFGAGAIAPLAAGFVYDAATALAWGPAAVWGWTFAVLGLGGIVATLSAAGLSRRAAV